MMSSGGVDESGGQGCAVLRAGQARSNLRVEEQSGWGEVVVEATTWMCGASRRRRREEKSSVRSRRVGLGQHVRYARTVLSAAGAKYF